MMIKYLFVLFLFLNISVYAQSADSLVWKQAAIEMASKLQKSFIERDFKKYAQLNHPTLVEMMGGEDGFAQTVKEQMDDIEKEIRIDSFSFGEPYHFVKTDSIVQCTMAQTMVMSSKDSTYGIRSRIYLLGISVDEGKNWYFLDSTNGAEFLDAVEPRRNKLYEVPNKEQEFLTKEKKN